MMNLQSILVKAVSSAKDVGASQKWYKIYQSPDNGIGTGTAVALLGTYLYTEAGKRFKAQPAAPKPASGSSDGYTGPTPKAV